MEWEPEQKDAWASDAQRWICQINGVLQCKIDVSDSGDVDGVHVVAGMERDPRHIVRDVESLLKARLDMDIYYKKIGVVQVLESSPPGGSESAVAAVTEAAHDTATPETELGPPPPQPAIPAVLVVEDPAHRIVCGNVSVMASDVTVRAEVHLSLGEIEARGMREGPNHADSDIALVAGAAVAAVGELIADPVLVHLRDVQLQTLGGHRVVMTAVDLVEGRQSTTLFGSCSAAHNRQQAVVYAVLDAVNRRLSMLGLKTLKIAE